MFQLSPGAADVITLSPVNARNEAIYLERPAGAGLPEKHRVITYSEALAFAALHRSGWIFDEARGVYRRNRIHAVHLDFGDGERETMFRTPSRVRYAEKVLANDGEPRTYATLAAACAAVVKAMRPLEFEPAPVPGTRQRELLDAGFTFTTFGAARFAWQHAVCGAASRHEFPALRFAVASAHSRHGRCGQ